MSKEHIAPAMGRIDVPKRAHIGLYPGTFDPGQRLAISISSSAR